MSRLIRGLMRLATGFEWYRAFPSQAGIFVNLEPLVGAILGVSLLQRSVGKNGTRRRCADYRRSRLFQLQACEKRFFLSQCAYQSSWVDQRLHDRHCDFQPRVQALWADASGVEL